MNNSIRLVIWALLIILFLLLYYSRNKQTPNLADAVNIALASGGLVTSANLLYLLMASPLKEILDKEVEFDVTAFYLGAIAAGWVSIQPITQLFKPNSFVGLVETCQINTGKIIHLHLTCRNQQVYRVVLTEDLFSQILKNIHNQPSPHQFQNPTDLIGKRISIFDVSPIAMGRVVELRVNQPEQLIINR